MSARHVGAQAGRWKVEVDDDLCTGHGRCYTLAPEAFDEDERGHCRVRSGILDSPELEKAARMGAESCPEQAIRVEEA